LQRTDIVTGVFGYPQEPAAKVALGTVKKWLDDPENDKKIDMIVFNVWTEKDLEIYNTLAPTVFDKEKH
jgi:O-acetyl-ADP-ribose deacetylase (regulator of RNase III)